ncbi:hypothetical protein CRV05_13535 [Halarcobacter bivalviorum]|uniref:Uncharacterized protein n=1 Tax=Halarcobacter bivalviorum TaxID=663364 RepID=A0AAX2A5H3_9BACT|nr:hypothetical protein CRV05_13535 [Halarcobacter bivalviorum]
MNAVLTSRVSDCIFSMLSPPVTPLIEFVIESVSLYTSSLFTATGEGVPSDEFASIVIVSPYSNVTTTAVYTTHGLPSASTSFAVYVILPPSSLVLVVASKITFTGSSSSLISLLTSLVSACSFSKLSPPVTPLIEFVIESVSLYTSSLFTATGAEVPSD